MLCPWLPKPVPVAAPQRKGKGRYTQNGDLPAVSSLQAEGDLVLEGMSAPEAAPQPGETSHEKTHPISQPTTPETAGEATPHLVWTCPSLPSPETSHPETTKEFAKHIKHIVLHGPHVEQWEGTQPAEQSLGLSQQPETSKYKPVAPLMTQECQFLEFLADNTEGIDFMHFKTTIQRTSSLMLSSQIQSTTRTSW